MGNVPSETPSIFKDVDRRYLYISTKQVPSATFLRGTSNFSVKKKRDILYHGGFPLQVKIDGEGTFQDIPSVRGGRSRCSYTTISELTEESTYSAASSTSRSLADLDDEVIREIPMDLGPEKSLQVKIKYIDPWKAHGLMLYQELARKPKSKLIIWNADIQRVSDPLPASTLGSRWTSKSKNRIRFQKIKDVGIKIYVLLYRTHWGNALMRLEKDQTTSKKVWAKRLIGRIKAFLKGKRDPIYSRRVTEKLGREDNPRLQEIRASRFLELLKTVDGIFTKRYLCNPYEAWTWQKYDMYTLWNINWLLTDEFFDGTISDQEVEIPTLYESLKRLRGELKYFGHTGATRESLDEHRNSVPTWLRSYFSVFQKIRRDDRVDYITNVNYLSQTRGCGSPPPLVVLKSKIKFLKTISSEPEPSSAIRNRFIRAAIENVIEGIPPHHFTGLSTKARISVTSAATFENLKREYGTIQSVQDLLLNGAKGIKAKVINLYTGKFEESIDIDPEPATYIFWRCLEFVMATPLDELKVAYTTMVREPAKARTVTKARTCLKIVLDVVSKICAAPLAKGLPSSTSGMKQSNQGWNFFKDMHNENLKDLVYGKPTRELIDETMDSAIFSETYRALFASSTDYEEATDSFDHNVARILGNRWMIQCGIPPILRGIVNATCYQSRKVFFTAKGPLKNIGHAHSEEERYVILRRGVLMGDPLTKVILHLLNVCVRYGARNLTDFNFLRRVTDYPDQVSNSAREAFNSKAPGLNRPR
jgi:hypothetical protein